MFCFLRSRRRQAEWLDEPNADPQDLRKSLKFIRKVNRTLGYTRLVIDQLQRFSSDWKPGQTIRILDVGTGSGDIPCAILRWAGQRRFDVRVTGVDLHPYIAREAAAAAADLRLQIVRGDALNLPFHDRSFDYAITSMFLHHLDDDQAAQALSEMERVAKRGVIVSDLLRKTHAYVFIWLATIFSNRMVRHDARVSVVQAFSKDEILCLRQRSGLEFAKYSTYLWHRFLLSGQRSDSAS